MLNKFIKLVIISILLIIPFVSTKDVYAKQFTYPDNQVFYNFKRLKEKMILITKFSKQKKFDYNVKLSQIRLEELIHIIENKNIAFIEVVNDRYQANIGRIIEDVRNNFVNFDKKELLNKFIKQQSELQESQKIYTFNSAEWRFTQDSINTLKDLINYLNVN